MNPLQLTAAHLKIGLVGLGKIVRKRPTLPILGHILLRPKGSDQLELITTDLDSWIAFMLPALGPLPKGAMALPYQELCNIVKACATEDILEVSAGDGNTVIIKCQVGDQKVEHRITGASVDEFPEVPLFSDQGVVLPEALPAAIQVAQQCSSNDATRYVLNGAFVDVSSDEGHYIVGTDGRHLVASNSFKLPLPRSLIIPNHRFLEWKGFFADGDWKLNLQPAAPNPTGVFQLSSHQWRFICREIEGQYPNWKHVFPDPDSYKTEVEFAPDVLDAVSQVIHRLPCHTEQFHTLGLEISRRRVRLLGHSRADTPWTKVEVPVNRISGEALTIFLDRELLLKAFRFGLSRISVIDAISPLLLTNADRSRQMIIMPLRPDGELTPEEGESPAEPGQPAAAGVTQAISESATSSFETIRPTPNPPTMPTYEVQPTTTTIIKAAPADETSAIVAPEVPDKPVLEAALDQIENIKSGFREGITHLSKLSEMLRQSIREQRTTHREFQAVRQTLRSLQNVRI